MRTAIKDPDKIRRAARRLAELRLFEGYWAEYGHPVDGYSITFGKAHDDEGQVYYYLFFSKELLPPFKYESYNTPEDLARRVVEIQPDLRRWKRRRL